MKAIDAICRERKKKTNLLETAVHNISKLLFIVTITAIHCIIILYTPQRRRRRIYNAPGLYVYRMLFRNLNNYTSACIKYYCHDLFEAFRSRIQRHGLSGKHC